MVKKIEKGEEKEALKAKGRRERRFDKGAYMQCHVNGRGSIFCFQNN